MFILLAAHHNFLIDVIVIKSLSLKCYLLFNNKFVLFFEMCLKRYENYVRVVNTTKVNIVLSMIKNC